MTSLLVTKQGNPEGSSRALLRRHYMNSLEDGSVLDHNKKVVQKVEYVLVDYIQVAQISFQRQYFVSKVEEI